MSAPHHILVIDDDRSLLRSMQMFLSIEGFSIESAMDGSEGLERVREHSFDLIVLDLQMPRMDGRSFYRAMRQEGYQTPVLILSAFGAEGARAELSADAAINKPFDPELLVEKIRSLLESRARK